MSSARKLQEVAKKLQAKITASTQRQKDEEKRIGTTYTPKPALKYTQISAIFLISLP